MDEENLLADRFEAERGRLAAAAYRMLGSRAEAEDAVQEAWLRLSRAGADGIGNLSGWLTTVVARVCLDMLRRRKSRREETLGGFDDDGRDDIAGEDDPAKAIEMADSVGLALLVVLETLSPAERIAFVLHDMFDLPFDEIAPIVERTPEAARQLASRARRRVQGRTEAPDASRERRRKVIDAFLAASRGGDFVALMSLLDPEVVFRADEAATRLGSLAEIRGAHAVAETFKGRAQGARTALIDGEVSIAVPVDGELRVALLVTIAGDRIAAIQAVADQGRLEEFEVEMLEG